MLKLLIKDETFSGATTHEMTIQMDSERVTIRDIIAARVTQEVQRYNEKATSVFSGLVEPTSFERELNGTKIKSFIDAEKQVYVALDAFQKNGFFVLIDQIQSESLDQEVQISANTTVSFIKLTALVGG
jgi:hypothetical protein